MAMNHRFRILISVVEDPEDGRANIQIGEWEYGVTATAADAISIGQHIRTHKLSKGLEAVRQTECDECSGQGRNQTFGSCRNCGGSGVLP
jgi:RecJ-like exonuclease